MAATKRALGRNIMVFASEVPVISALNPYRKIEDVFLDVWRRTNPRQVSSLQKHLSLALPSPEEKMQAIVQDLGAAPAINELIQEASEAKTIHQVAIAQAKVVQSLPSTTPADVKADVVQFVTSTMHKGFGVKQETAGIEQYQEKEKCQESTQEVYEPFAQVRHRPVADISVHIGRAGRELVEHLHADKAQTKMTKVPWDDKMWNAEIEPYLVQFGSALTYLMKDKTAQKDYLQSDAGQQREIIRYLWSQEFLPTPMADDKELRETVRAAFACYDEDGSGWIDAAELRHLVSDLGGVLTERDFHKALRLLDRDSNGVIDRDEFTQWWVGQSEGNEAVGEVEKALARLKDFGRQRFRVDIHTACWNGFEDVVERLVEDGSELVNERDSSEYGVSWVFYDGAGGENGSGCTPVFFAAQQGHVEVVKLLLQVLGSVN
ncbi:Ankyrin repeat-containing domain [Phytophthora cactorum]|nr:Ankyrin repeat-containing domain [Phytophthora cactorum]